MARVIRVMFFSLLLVVATAYSVQAAEPEIYITTRSVDDTGLYEAMVSIANNPGIAGYDLAMEFDNTVLTPVSIEEGDTLSGMIFISNVMGATEERLAEMGAVTAVWGSAGDNYENGVIYTVLFRAAESATGTTELRLLSRGIGSADGYAVDFVLTGAVIEFGDRYTHNVADGDNGAEPGQSENGSLNILIIIIALLSLVIIILILIVIKSRKRKDERFKKTTYRR